MKKTALILLSFMWVIGLSGQDKEYDEIFASISSSRDYEVYQNLLAYQKKFPYFANTYYQLGIISQKWMRQDDPFLQSNDVKEYVRNAELYFSLCSKYCDETEARKNREYYQEARPAPGKEYPDYSTIREDIEIRIKDVEAFKKHFNYNQSYLVRSVSDYNRCITTFNQVNASNSRLKDLYFIADEEILNSLNDIKKHFDSAVYYYDAFLLSLSQYPMGNYKPDYELLPLTVYRLHGLTSSDFLSQKVPLWDFGSWVNDFFSILQTDIAELNQQAFKINFLHNAYLEDLNNGQLPAALQDYTLDPALINKIYRYDFTSSLGGLFEYQEAKIRYLFYSISGKMPIPGDSLRLLEPVRDPAYFYNLVRLKTEADSILNFLGKLLSPESVAKYSEFFSREYNGFTGLQKYIAAQRSENANILQQVFHDYAEISIHSHQPDTVVKALFYNNIQLNCNIINPGILQNGYCSYHKTLEAENKTLLSGSNLKGSTAPVAFLSLIDSSGNVEWIKNTKPGFGIIAKPTGDGYIQAIHNRNQKTESVFLLDLDLTANIKNSREIKTKSVPRILQYDDINQTTLLVCKGDNYESLDLSGDSLELYLFDGKLSPLWTKKVAFTGLVSDVIRTNDLFYIYGAYNRFTSPTGVENILPPDFTNGLVLVYDTEGNFLRFVLFDKNFSYIPLKTAKINSELVEMIAMKNTPSGIRMGMTKDHDTYYFMIKNDGEVVFSNP